MTIEEITINPADYAVRLTTTHNRLKTANACAPRYEHLVRALGGVSFDHDASINLLTILEHNGVEDCLWALCTTAENCDQVARLMAADFAEAMLPIFERERPNDSRPRDAINIARAYADTHLGAHSVLGKLEAEMVALVHEGRVVEDVT